jgi:hypothetical protein
MGLKGFVREPRVTARERRNSVALAGDPQFVGAGSVIFLDGDGILQILLDTPSGLENNAGALRLDLDTAGEDLLELNAAGLNVNEDEMYSFAMYYG